MKSWAQFLSLALVLATGCSKPVEEVRSHVFAADTTLAAAYGQLLSNVAWEKVSEETGTYVEVSGILRHREETLRVRYALKPRPPVVLEFSVGGTTHPAEKFPTFLTDACWRLEIAAGLP